MRRSMDTKRTAAMGASTSSDSVIGSVRPRRATKVRPSIAASVAVPSVRLPATSIERVSAASSRAGS